MCLLGALVGLQVAVRGARVGEPRKQVAGAQVAAAATSLSAGWSRLSSQVPGGFFTRSPGGSEHGSPSSVRASAAQPANPSTFASAEAAAPGAAAAAAAPAAAGAGQVEKKRCVPNAQ